ncbi:hypothetical protein C9374_004886 [Naegleria lovaniensis]|uniref:Uncharacterized protein n=1 Tax=Naegleria lovaniensis TaxID=51637 RepID=A0AA88GL41_NAELO|nr:uncharacterized protein C9374_004886 [Naegleria lovaniensis]KAG2382919.1 hypothetical protein C9374_004886 [Naegleria lovaniensis]
MVILSKLFKSINSIELNVHPHKKQSKMPTQPSQPSQQSTNLKMEQVSQPQHPEVVLVESLVQQVKSLSLSDADPILVSSSPRKVQQVGPMSKPQKKKPNLQVNTEKNNKRTVPPYAISLPRKHHATEQLSGDVIRNVFMQWITTTEYSKFYEKYQ